MNALAELDAALDALDGALGGLNGPGARRLIERRVRAVLDERYGDGAAQPYRLESESDDGCSGPTSDLETRIVAFLEANPRASARALRDGVEGRARDIDAAVARLVASGVVQDDGDEYRRCYTVSGAGHAVSRP